MSFIGLRGRRSEMRRRETLSVSSEQVKFLPFPSAHFAKLSPLFLLRFVNSIKILLSQDFGLDPQHLRCILPPLQALMKIVVFEG